jgi:hypothetical protein
MRKHTAKWPLGKVRMELEDNIKMHLIEIWSEDVKWISLAKFMSNGYLWYYCIISEIFLLAH